MIGNDVVDLGDLDALPGATHPRFDERVFDADERHAIQSNATPNRLRWILWAAKESAFKALRKLDDRTIFSPRRLSVALDGAGRGTVLHAGRRVDVVVEDAEDAVHVIATGSPAATGALISEVGFTSSEGASAAARRLLIAAVAPRLGVAAEDLEVVRVHRVPRLHVRGQLAPVDISLSHHGRFVACACALRPPRAELRGAT